MNPDAPAFPDFVPGTGTGAGDKDFKATAGEPLPAGTAPASEDAVVAALRTVHDPEIPVNIYDLGLVYKLAIGADGDVAVDMTLTAPGCPVAGEMPGQVAEAVAKVEGVGRVSVTLVWEPGWTPERMSADAKLALGMI
ncbi:MAG: SUF system Fe-S cluster assembly protein [Rhodospirillales bacterium]